MSTPLDINSVDPAEFARAVKEGKREDLEALMSSELRGQILDEIFSRMATHARTDRLAGVDAVVHWKILDRPGGGYDLYESVLRNEAVTVGKEQTAEPDVTLKINPADFLKLITGNAEGPMLFISGKLKIDGNIALAARLTSLFSIPRA